MVVIGGTGGVGTGKSTVAKMFKELGAAVLDADVMAHQLMEPKQLCWRRIVERFGEGVLNEDQTINRRRLAEIVFHDSEQRKQLEAIIHPLVLRQMKQRLHRLRRSRRIPAVVLDVPLLVEADAQGMVDTLVVVTAPRDIQRERLTRRYGETQEGEARIASQMELSAKVALADAVVETDGTLDATRTQVKRIWEQLGLNRKHRSKSSSPRSSTSRR